MNYMPNAIKWGKGALVLADSDAKEPKMLMKVIGYTRDGRCKTQYLFKDRVRRIWKNDIKYLHNPERWFSGSRNWKNWSQERLEEIQLNFERVRRWNLNHEIGTLVKTTSVDGGFEAKTRTKAYFDSGGQAFVFLEGVSGWWTLEFVKAISTIPEDTDTHDYIQKLRSRTFKSNKIMVDYFGTGGEIIDVEDTNDD